MKGVLFMSLLNQQRWLGIRTCQRRDHLFGMIKPVHVEWHANEFQLVHNLQRPNEPDHLHVCEDDSITWSRTLDQ